MFFNGNLGAYNLTYVDPSRSRKPPQEATPVVFPVHDPGASIWAENGGPHDYQSLFSKIAKPADVLQLHLDALNIEICPLTAIDELLPPRPNGSSYLPDPTITYPDESRGYASVVKGYDPDFLKKDFAAKVKELKVDDELASQIIARAVPRGQAAPRLTHFRKFYEGLDDMARYWDSSLENYYELDDNEQDRETSTKRQKLQDESTDDESSASTDNMDVAVLDRQEDAPESSHQRNTSSSDAVATTTSEGQSPRIDSETSPMEITDTTKASTDSDQTPTPPLTPPSDLEGNRRYKGRRMWRGAAMPERFRVDTAKAFLEAAVWPFVGSLTTPRTTPLVHFNSLRVPVRQTAAVYRVPHDLKEARRGILLGPVMALQARTEVEFVDSKGNQDASKARLDLMREIGGLLQLAQERRREGKTEVKPGEGKWWTTKPRWGGSPGSEAQNNIGNADILSSVEHMLGAGRRARAPAPSRTRKTPAMLWKELKCGSGYWDPKTVYKAVGKDPNSDYDQVFLVSVLFHHISILKLTFHTAYIDFLISGDMPATMPADPDWCRPRLQRTKWFNLFDSEQRVELFRGLWGVMAYMFRNESFVD